MASARTVSAAFRRILELLISEGQPPIQRGQMPLGMTFLFYQKVIYYISLRNTCSGISAYPRQ